MRLAWWTYHQERFTALCAISNGSDFHDQEPASRMITRGPVTRAQKLPETRKDRIMTTEHSGLSRRTLLSTAALGVPALGLLGAANLIGAPAANAKKTRITLDGWWGHETTKLLQAALGFPQTGVIDSQPASLAKQNTALYAGWDWVPDGRAKGAPVLRELQKMLEVPQDGLIGPVTIKALQTDYGGGTALDGVLVGPSPTVKGFQLQIEFLTTPGIGQLTICWMSGSLRFSVDTHTDSETTFFSAGFSPFDAATISSTVFLPMP